ncbi:MAG: hypothetical protein SFY66_19555 [Oculatellaceae cyanobacterium bins.114]|nr:hypothetical protein [Oculatellaceae cyanobacterium bins.114]
MPMERDRYPKNWDEIALKVKESADWKCQQCDRPCRRTGEDLGDFIKQIQGCNHSSLDWVNQTAVSTICEHPARFVLTVAHLDQDPSNNDPSNLKALCSGCHLKHDAPFRAANTKAKLERKGQLSLDMLTPPKPAGNGKDPTRIQLPIRGG